MTEKRYTEITEAIRNLTEKTRWEGHLFAVGGCCRDMILGAEIKDVDLAVDLPNGGIDFARWLQSKGLLAEKPVFFEKFGTARIILKQFPAEEIELVQTRREKYTKESSRCPEVVSGTLEEDCFRRDFTVNTLYYDITGSRMLDMTGRGVADIEQGCLRTPLDPDTTFDDDPVRILRCLRFSTRFGWKIEESTYAALCRNISRLEIVSRERFHSEIEKMLTGPAPYASMKLMDETGAIRYANPLIAEFIDQSKPEGKIPGVWQYQVENLKNLTYVAKERRTLAVALALLFCDLGKLRTRVKDKRGNIRYPRHELTGAAMARRMMRSMKFDPQVVDTTAFLILNHHRCGEWGADAEEMTDKALKTLQKECGSEERFALLLDFLKCRDPENIGRYERVEVRSEELVDEQKDNFSQGPSSPTESRRRSRSSRHRPHRKSKS